MLLGFISSKNKEGEQLKESIITPTTVPIRIPAKAQIPAPKIQIPTTVLVNRLGNVSFSLSNNPFPKKTNLYGITPFPISPSNAKIIAQALFFTNEGRLISTNNGNALVYQEGVKNLIFYLEAGNIQYSSSITFGARSALIQEEIIDIAQNYLKKFYPYSQNLTPDPSSTIYFAGTGDVSEVKKFEDADVYDIPFVRRVSNLPIFAQFGSHAQAHVWIDRSKQIQKLTLNTQDTLTTSQGREIISIDEAKNKIIKGEGTIVSYGSIGQYNALPVPDRTIFTTVDLGYLRDTSNRSLYPIFVFKGSAFANDREEPIVVYLPAFK